MGSQTEHNEATLTEAICKRWPTDVAQPRHIVAVQVNNGAGHSYRRRIDAIVIDTWPSAGLYWSGFEIKTNSKDLRRELQDPAKFEAWEPFLDFFSIVAPAGVVKMDLLPPKWGLYLPDGNGSLRARRKPLKLHDEKRRTISRSMSAAFARALVSRSLSKAAKEAAYESGKFAADLFWKTKVNRAEEDLKRIRDTIAQFEEASGVSIPSWKAGEVGRAVKLILDGGMDVRLRYANNIRDVGERLVALADELDELKATLRVEEEG